jgi:prepilin-type N-terminal cleavage/methylation domain-containing protein
MNIIQDIKKEKGMTLVELLVVIAMLSLTITALSGIFRNVVKGQARALTSQQLMDQSSYVTEYMSRALRMAKKDDGTCIGNNLNYFMTRSGNGIKFMNYNGECQEFYLDTNDSKLKEVKNGITNSLTSDKIEVISFNIGPNDSWDQNDDLQPRVTIFLESKGKRKMLASEEQPIIKIQTTISQRNISL